MFTNDDPLNAEDPLGLCWGWCTFTEAGHAISHTYDDVRHGIATAASNPLVIGVALGGFALLTGGTAFGLELGFIAEEAVGGSALALSATSFAAGAGATALDHKSCSTGNSLACVGQYAGALGAVGTLAEASVAASISKALVGPSSLAAGLTALLVDLLEPLGKNADKSEKPDVKITRKK